MDIQITMLTTKIHIITDITKQTYRPLNKMELSP